MAVKQCILGLRFFRVLLPGFSNQLPIARALVKRIINEGTKERATLLSPDGKSWQVDLRTDTESEDMFFGGDEWLKLSESLGFELGYFLVFRYRGSMVFSFKVYDLSTCEKTYSEDLPKRDDCKRKIGETCVEEPDFKRQKREVCSDEHKSVRLPVRRSKRLIVQRLTNERKSTPPKKVVQTHKEKPKRKIVKVRIAEHKSKPPKRKSKRKIVNRRNSSSDKGKSSKDRNTSKTKRYAKKVQPKTTISATKRRYAKKEVQSKSTIGATKRRYATKAQFKATIGATNLTGSYMSIPTSFRSSIGLSVNDKEVYLRDPKAKTWLLGLYHRPDFSKSYIMKGWRAFVRENKLKKGDNYVFELTSCKKGIMHMQMCKLQNGRVL